MNKPAIRFKGFEEEWHKRTLNDACTSFKYGLNAAASPYDGQHKYLRITDIDDTTRQFSKYDLTTPLIDSFTEGFRLKANDIVFARTGASVGKSYLYNSKDGEVYWAGFLIRAAVNNLFDANFVFQTTLTNDYWKYINISSQRSGQPGVNAEQYAALPFFAPVKFEQMKIGNYFKRIDEMITEVEREISRLEKMKQASLQKMFPRPGQTTPEIRFAGFTEPWEIKTLGEIGNTFTGLSGKTKEDFGHGQARFITYMNVFSNPISKINLVDAVEIDHSQNSVQSGDILFTTSSETPEEVGLSSVWEHNTPNVYLNSFCFGFRPNVRLHLYYMAYFLRSPFFRKNMVTLAQGISRFNISKLKVMELPILLPNENEQKIIGSYFRNLDSLLSAKRQKLVKLRNIKKACLDKMFVNTSHL